MSAHGSRADGTRASRPVVNSLGMKLVGIPPGEFIMGNRESPEALTQAFPAYEPQRISDLVDESPPHRVRITRAFHLGMHQVTIGQFARFVTAAGYQTEAERDGTGGYGYDPQLGDFIGRRREFSWRNTGFSQADDHPVVNITWHDAHAFCHWLTHEEGHTYRLPTEAEWEYACRAGTTTRYFCGDDPELLAGVANVFDAAGAAVIPAWRRFAIVASDGFAFTAPVGSFPPNPFGLHDMHGNVWEWCADWYAADYYARSPEDDPRGPDEGETRVRRGAAWHSWPLYLRSSFRNFNTPESRYLNLGFRVARNA